MQPQPLLPVVRSAARRGLILLAACALAAAPAGCESMRDWFGKKKPPAEPAPPPAARSTKAVDDTVQSVARISGLQTMVVRGYGLVVGLVGTGGGDCPDEVRRFLEKEVARRRSKMTLREILDRRDAAPVAVTAEIPAAAKAGTFVDVVVQALGSQTTSLAGGTLLDCDLKVLADSPRGIIEGKAVARARGPIFQRPYRRDKQSFDEPRAGLVLGGGILGEDRRVRLQMSTPTYNVAARIRDRLNGRFEADRPVADAVSPDEIHLTIPREFLLRERYFLNLALHTYLNGNPGFLQRRAAELADEIDHPRAYYEEIAWAWEAIGKTILPVIRPVYGHATAAASFYAARAGARLGDEEAVAVLARHAADGPFTALAIDELGSVPNTYRAGEALMKVASGSDNLLRIAAYKSLLRLQHPGCVPERVGRENFILDRVDCAGPPLVFVATTGQQRIAILGANPRVRPPLAYHDDLVTLAADASADALRAARFNPRSRQTSPPMNCPLDLPSLVRFLGRDPVELDAGKFAGIGLDYSSVVRVLARLSADGALGATFILERPTVSDELFRVRPRERPESDQ
ncbi:MAG: flagellar basal body P-ring protein FlgI [Phycisphaerae bacterium]